MQEATVPDIWLADRRVTLTDGAAGAVAAALGWTGSSQLYLPRITGIGEPGSDTLISQDIKGSSDSVRFTFGNADRTMTDLSNDTDLKYAEIDFCAFNVNSGIVIQIWKGVIQNFTSDGTPNFPVVCSDGFFQIMNQYPERQASRQCWKTYNDGVYCLWATKGASAAAVMHAVAQAVKAAYSGAKVEWLLPFDTNNPTVYWNAGYPYPQGGRLNNYVNIPSQFMAPNGDIDRLKLEALSWGATYLNLDLAKAAMAYGTTTMTYAKSATAYLVPWFNGACAWVAQYLAAVNAGMPIICFWAVDHLTLLSWPLPPLPVNSRAAKVF